MVTLPNGAVAGSLGDRHRFAPPCPRRRRAESRVLVSGRLQRVVTRAPLQDCYVAVELVDHLATWQF